MVGIHWSLFSRQNNEFSTNVSEITVEIGFQRIFYIKGKSTVKTTLSSSPKNI